MKASAMWDSGCLSGAWNPEICTEGCLDGFSHVLFAPWIGQNPKVSRNKRTSRFFIVLFLPVRSIEPIMIRAASSCWISIFHSCIPRFSIVRHSLFVSIWRLQSRLKKGSTCMTTIKENNLVLCKESFSCFEAFVVILGLLPSLILFLLILSQQPGAPGTVLCSDVRDYTAPDVGDVPSPSSTQEQSPDFLARDLHFSLQHGVTISSMYGIVWRNSYTSSIQFIWSISHESIHGFTQSPLIGRIWSTQQPHVLFFRQ